MDVKRYTLAEAQHELAVRECRGGHSFDVTEVRNHVDGVILVRVHCPSCGWGGLCNMNGADPSRPSAGG
jgi:hypothetical protein